MWDSDTLGDEKKARPNMAEAILGNPPNLGDPIKLRKRIAELNTNRRENDPAWWNDLAGAHIRLGESKRAAELLESVVTRFPNDYGVHANLGTAYHLLGRYQEAEKEIARDLDINPDAHFGLEKYHLALLQYLVRDAKYQHRHVYVDEFTGVFMESNVFLRSGIEEGLILEGSTNTLAQELPALEKEYAEMASTNSSTLAYKLHGLLGTMAECDDPPLYRTKWNLATNSLLQEGVIYMASLNPSEPACFVMLGILSIKNHDLNLAEAAFDKAIKLGSPQAEILRVKREVILKHIREARTYSSSNFGSLVALACGAAIILVIVLRGALRWFHKRSSR